MQRNGHMFFTPRWRNDTIHDIIIVVVTTYVITLQRKVIFVKFRLKPRLEIQFLPNKQCQFTHYHVTFDWKDSVFSSNVARPEAQFKSPEGTFFEEISDIRWQTLKRFWRDSLHVEKHTSEALEAEWSRVRVWWRIKRLGSVRVVSSGWRKKKVSVSVCQTTGSQGYWRA